MKQALFLTGAAARISQEVAIIDQLMAQKGLSITPEDTFLAGFSSGALNMTALNACFRKEKPLSWDQHYKKEILFRLTSEQVYQKRQSFPFDTAPLRKTIEEFVLEAGFNCFSDLPFCNYILAFSIRRLSVFWASNHPTLHGNSWITDLLMATSAIPILFPEQAIETPPGLKNKLPSGSYLDGGATGTFVGFKRPIRKIVKQNGPFDILYIISPMRELTAEDFEEFDHFLPSNDLLKLSIKELGLLKNFLNMISMNGFDTFIRQFYRWISKRRQPVAKEIMVCVPQLPRNFPIMNFNRQEEQYHAVADWAINYPEQLAIPLSEYMEKFSK
jgi:hypothetical protein